MEKITLYRNKLMYKNSEEKSKTIDFSEAYKFLWTNVEVHKSVKIRSLMDIISTDVEFYIKCLSNPYLRGLVEHYKDPLFSAKPNNLSRLNFSWHVESWEYDEYGKEFEIFLDLCGKSDEDPAENYGLTFTRLDSIVDLPFDVDDNIIVYYHDCRKSSKKKRKKHLLFDNKHEFGKKTTSLIDIIRCFSEEMTWIKDEDSKEEALNELNNRVEEAHKAIESGDMSGFVSMEEIKKRIKDRTKGDENIDEIDEASFRDMMGE